MFGKSSDEEVCHTDYEDLVYGIIVKLPQKLIFLRQDERYVRLFHPLEQSELIFPRNH